MEAFQGVLSLLLVLSVGGLGVSLLSKLLRLPTIVGYAVLGALIGPYGFELLSDSEQIPQIAEIGMMALLFSIDLKFNLDMFRSLQRHIFVFGGLQFFVCTAVGMALLLPLGIGWYDSLIYAAAFALSSTAVVTKLLLERGEFATRYGTRSISALLFQDLAVVLLLILIPDLAAYGEAGDGDVAVLYEMGVILAEIVLLFVVIVFFGPRLMPMWMRFIAKSGSNEIFSINLLAIIFGFSWATEHFGFSLALGAFLAGMLLAETPQKYQVEEIISPFREIFLGFFFDFLEITLIVLPVFTPIVQELDFGTHVVQAEKIYWFALLVAVNLQTSFLTPPFGFALFYMKGVAPPEVRLSSIYRGIIPFVCLQLIGLGFVLAWPDIALWLPRVMLD